MKSARTTVGISIIAAVLIAAGEALLPTPSAWNGDWLSFYVPLATTTAFAPLFVGAAALFLMSLDAYKQKLRLAYIAISGGIVLLAGGTLVVAVLTAFGQLNNSFWSKSGLIIIPFLAAGLTAYLGVRALGRLVGAKTPLLKLSVTLPVALGLTLLSTLLPHVATTTNELTYDISNMITVWTGAMYGASMVIVRVVAGSIGDHYKRAMKWLSYGFTTSFIILVFVIAHGLATTATSDPANMLIDVASLISGLIYLRAGYEFTLTKEL